ncbi:uncharacterized protein LOC113760576 [Coffea eugenioides]|uniref:Glycoprotein-N-acetylgalactosamine 3-beta-galactosyltransferase 1-like n=1 Tax=Coffea arabica TaxID=13443 RepID=A0A6P6W8M0_COFAR|nr:uncharacterized protein LOC113730453 [Coffea arabica]XP_027159015.1 uncharacterized protein LOC113760576 [Coffea eugenioides]
MSQTREKSGQETLNPFKPFLVSNQRNDFLTTSVKGGILAFLFVSAALLVYSVFTSQPPWFICPECPNPTDNISTTACNTEEGPISSPTNITHIVFGIGGSTSTWNDRSHYSALWWQDNITRGFVWLDKEPDAGTPWPENSPPYRVSSDWTRFRYTSSQSAVRLSRIVVDSFRVGLPDVRWFVMGDDDTVFFPDNLVTVLAKYDHRQMYYVGGNSESVEQDITHSYDMAFGGGGIAISYPLAAELVRVMDGCLDRYYNFYGSDERVWACIKELGVSLTRERGFHQIDIRGDLFGLLAAHPMVPLVSLHHLDHVKPLFPNLTQHESLENLIQAYHMDPAQIMQQSFCYHGWYKWSVSISWGYAAQIYPSLLIAGDLEKPLQTFRTWRSWSNGPFIFNTRPVNPDPCERPAVYYIEGIGEDGNGGTLTSYRRSISEPENCRGGHHGHAVGIERVLVSALKMDQKEWKSPRRRCCEIKSSKDGTLKVLIRRCNQQESITP